VREVALRQNFLRVLLFSPANIIPPMLLPHLSPSSSYMSDPTSQHENGTMVLSLVSASDMKLDKIQSQSNTFSLV